MTNSESLNQCTAAPFPRQCWLGPSPTRKQAIRLRFGIGCEREHTLEEIGQEFDVARERIRQIEAKALRQVRAPERAQRAETSSDSTKKVEGKLGLVC